MGEIRKVNVNTNERYIIGKTISDLGNSEILPMDQQSVSENIYFQNNIFSQDLFYSQPQSKEGLTPIDLMKCIKSVQCNFVKVDTLYYSLANITTIDDEQYLNLYSSTKDGKHWHQLDYIVYNPAETGFQTYTSVLKTFKVVMDASLLPKDLNSAYFFLSDRCWRNDYEQSLLSQWHYTIPDNAIIDNGKYLYSTGIEDNKNDHIAYYNNIKNAWWISCTCKVFDRGDNISIGLCFSERKSNEYFRMLKFNAYNTTQKNTLFEYYTRNNKQWLDNNVIAYEEVSYLKSEYNLCFCLSDNIAHTYIDNELYKHSVIKSIPYDSHINMYAGILFNRYYNLVKNIKIAERPAPYAHFSVDDVFKQLKDLSTELYDSIFDNQFFKFWKDLHNKYGVVVTMNIFYEMDNDNWTLSDMPVKYKDEFMANSSWLKFACHSYDNVVMYNEIDDIDSAVNGYNTVINEIIRFAGNPCVDSFPRLTYFSGTKEFLIQLKEKSNFTGCFTADDDRVLNCGLTGTEINSIKNCSDLIDFENQLYYIRTRRRLDNITTETREEIFKEIDRNMSVYEFFNHGTSDQIIEDVAEALYIRRVRFDFPQNNLPF